MSFVEKNKTWILPVLGLGAGAVVWFNIRTFNPPVPSAQTAPSTVAATPATPPAPEVPPPSGAGDALWDDLSPVAFVPAELGVQAALEQRALVRLGPEALADPAAPLITRPGAADSPRNPQKASRAKEGAPAFAPPPDFLIEGPGGTQAWFDGHGYRTGQPLKGHPFTVQGIQIQPTPGVTLQGATGSTSRSTRHAPAQEAP